MNYFEYNGVKSSSMGLRIQSKNVFSAPKYDAQFVSVPGRNGDLIVSNNRYENVQISYSVFVPAKSISELSEKITSIKAWLYAEPSSYHKLTDTYDTKFYRKAVFSSSLDIEEELNKIGVFTITFNCKPFRYSLDGDLPNYIRSTQTNNFQLIFCRMDGGNNINDWSYRWNQTADLSIPDGKNLFTINDGSWSEGTWGTYSPAQAGTIYLKPNSNWKIDNARFSIYTFGSDGEHWYSMTKINDDLYSAALPFSTDYTSLTNPYEFESKPYIRVFGNGSGSLVITSNNKSSKWDFSSIEEYLEIDSEQMNFYKDTVLKNDTVTGNGFPTLAPGENTFILSGGITSLSVFPRWCTL